MSVPLSSSTRSSLVYELSQSARLSFNKVQSSSFTCIKDWWIESATPILRHPSLTLPRERAARWIKFLDYRGPDHDPHSIGIRHQRERPANTNSKVPAFGRISRWMNSVRLPQRRTLQLSRWKIDVFTRYAYVRCLPFAI